MTTELGQLIKPGASARTGNVGLRVDSADRCSAARLSGKAQPRAAGHQAQPEAAAPHALPRTVIRPPSGWQLVSARELWQYRARNPSVVQRQAKVRALMRLFAYRGPSG